MAIEKRIHNLVEGMNSLTSIEQLVQYFNENRDDIGVELANLHQTDFQEKFLVTIQRLLQPGFRFIVNRNKSADFSVINHISPSSPAGVTTLYNYYPQVDEAPILQRNFTINTADFLSPKPAIALLMVCGENISAVDVEVLSHAEWKARQAALKGTAEV